MPLSREPSLRNWMKWSSSSSSNSNSSPALTVNKEPSEIIHLGGGRLESPLIVIPPNFLDERRLTAWPGGPPPPAPPAGGLARSNTDAAALGHHKPLDGPEATESLSKSNPASFTLRPAPGRTHHHHQQQSVDSFSLLSPPLSATTGYHASFFPQRPQESEDERPGDRSPASSISAASSSQFSIKPPPPLRTREALASPLTPATSIASGPRTAPFKTPTDSYYYDQLSPDAISVVSSPGGRPVLHTKSPSHSGHFPTRSSSKGPNSQPKHLRRSQSAVDNSRKYKTAGAPAVSVDDMQEETEPEWPLSPVPLEMQSKISQQPTSANLPQVVVVDYPPPHNSPPKRPLPKIVSISGSQGVKTQLYSDVANERLMPPKTPTSQNPRHTTQERLWLHKNYRGEAAFLKAWGLDIEKEEDRQEGKTILQELMQAEDDEAGDSLVGARLRLHQHSTSSDRTNTSSTSSSEDAGLHVIEEEETRSPPALKASTHSRSASSNRRANGSSSTRGRAPPPRGHFKSESETSVLGSYLETWIEK